VPKFDFGAPSPRTLGQLEYTLHDSSENNLLKSENYFVTVTVTVKVTFNKRST